MKIHSLLISTLAIAIAHAQEKPADPFREAPSGEPAALEASEPKNISICYETFSLPLALAAKLQREQLVDSELYTRLVAAVEKQTARQETFTVLRAKSGQKATTESISEQIYPTEFEPAEIPNSVGVSITPPSGTEASAPVLDTEKLKNAANPAVLNGLKTSAAPKAFDTRNTGVTLEIEPTLGNDQRTLDLRLVPEHVALVDRSAWGQGVSTAEMPLFETQRVNTSATVQINQPFLLSTISRPPVSKIDPDSANRVWFAFVTATLAKP